jgi:putative oxidoreductase
MGSQHSSALAAALVRVSLGTMFIAHGLLKLVVFTLPGTAQFFASQGFPGWAAYPVVAGEIVGGVLLLAGIGSRVVSLALLPVLIGSIAVHAGNGWLFSASNGGWEYPVLLVALSISVALSGDGDYSLANLLRGGRVHAGVGVRAAAAR